MVATAVGGTYAHCWLENETFDNDPVLKDRKAWGLKNDKRTDWQPSLFYNAMVKPLMPYSAKTIIWYQGEGNSHPELMNLYSYELKLLISQWRKGFQEENLPFCIVQLPSYGKDGFKEVRLQQLKTYQETENTGLITTMDTGDSLDIHPQDKLIIGKRIAEWIVKSQEQNNYKISPIVKKQFVENDRIIIEFDNIGDKLISTYFQSPMLTPNCIEISSDNIHFEYAKARLKPNTNNQIEVWNEHIKEPKYVRYLYDGYVKDKVCLYNYNGIPITLF